MKIYKFGGASVKDAEGVRNVARVLATQDFDCCLLVVSAMGKTTNALEKVVADYFDQFDYQSEIEKIRQNHLAVVSDLFEKSHPVFAEISNLFNEIATFLDQTKSPNYDFVYDQVVSFGELVSSKILSYYLNEIQLINQFLDARAIIKTNSNYREGVVNWDLTEKNISGLNRNQCFVTQGFIGSDDNNFTVTLGREGSDYTAAIFAYCLDADEMTIWKDVQGVMTGDPRKFDNVQLLTNISYEEAIEMAYYGASVIHPKTLQPLKQKNIPFYVKSFLDPSKSGTKVGISSENVLVESFILKENQILLTVQTRDFSFIAEEHISLIFNLLYGFRIKVSLMQNSAISLALCLEDKFGNIDEVVTELQQNFNTQKTENVVLFTVRNVNLNAMERFYKNKTILLEQLTKRTLQMVTT